MFVYYCNTLYSNLFVKKHSTCVCNILFTLLNIKTDKIKLMFSIDVDIIVK